VVSWGGGQGESPAERARRVAQELRGERGRSPRAGGLSGGDAARLALVEQQLAELQAEVAQLKWIVSRLSGREPGGDLLEGGLATQAGLDVRTGAGAHPSHAEVVLTVIAAATRSDDRYRRGAVVVRGGPEVHVHVVVHAPAELNGWASGRPSPLREHAADLVDGMRERLSGQAAGRAVDVLWAPATGGWRVVDFGSFDKMAGFPTQLDDWGHRQAGAWVAQAGTAAGLPADVTGGAGAVIRYLVPLPFDPGLHDVSRVIQVAGILAFALPGGHVLACASLKSLVHDEITDLLAKQLRAVIWPGPATPDPGQPQPPGPPANPPGPPASPNPDDLSEQRPWHPEPGGGFGF
jgi:hypothetical protein